MKKTSQEIMNEIERLQPDGVAYYGKEINDRLLELQIQKQERLECYKKEMEFLQEFITNGYYMFNENPRIAEGIRNRMTFLEQEIKILEEK